MGSWWGRILLLILGGFFIYSMYGSFVGTDIPPLGADGKKHIRKGSTHTSHYRGYYFGGGMGSGK